MLRDEMIHGAVRGSRRAHHIEEDTPLVPYAAASAVYQEASAWLDRPLPEEWIGKLISRAERLYVRKADFRRRIRCRGNYGRNWLWAYMRHWLATLARRDAPGLIALLPAEYGDGQEPPKRPAQLPIDKVRPPLRPRRKAVLKPDRNAQSSTLNAEELRRPSLRVWRRTFHVERLLRPQKGRRRPLVELRRRFVSNQEDCR